LPEVRVPRLSSIVKPLDAMKGYANCVGVMAMRRISRSVEKPFQTL
jgi:hypothetical protein